MIVVLSGEGPSDLGQCSNAQAECRIPEFMHGPMALIVDKIIEETLGFSPLELTLDWYIYLSEERLQELVARRKQTGSKVSLVGKKRDQETGYFYINAWMLGEETIRLQHDGNVPAIGILFRDSDGTRSTIEGLWQAKIDSMVGGFDRATLGARGIPMVPQPKSEAWLLCAARAAPYVNCAPLEKRSGNDHSPRPLKGELAAVLHGDASAQAQIDWLTEHGFDHVAVAQQMNSFGTFKRRLCAALLS